MLNVLKRLVMQLIWPDNIMKFVIYFEESFVVRILFYVFPHSYTRIYHEILNCGCQCSICLRYSSLLIYFPFVILIGI